MTDPLEGDRAGALASAPTPLRDQRSSQSATILLPPLRVRVRDASIVALQELGRRLGRDTLSAADVEAAHEARQDPDDRSLAYDSLRRRFGAFGDALRAAGLRPASETPRYDDDECFVNMGRVWRSLGRPPRCCDMQRAPSTVGPSAYIKRAGSWRAAVEAYAAFTGADPHRPGPPSVVGLGLSAAMRAKADAARADDEPSRPARIRRGLDASRGNSTPLALRFRVLQRDRFRCTACGNSPSRDADCALQVDHILPRSKGGRSTLDNLRCLCAACNLGRGDRDAGARATADGDVPG